MTQPQSALLRLPTELRHEIYSYLLPSEVHVRLRDGNLCASACIRGGSPFRGHALSHDIRFTDETWQDRVSMSMYARRLQSTWGLHWSCEEHTSLSDGAECPDIVGVCRVVRHEVYDLLARTSTVHVSDLDLLDKWARASEVATPVAFKFAKMPVSNVIRLSITLKLPLAFFRSIEQLSGNDPTYSDTAPTAQQVRLWQRLSSTLSHFEALKKLDLWLDHNEPQCWVVVNERSTLDLLLTQLSARPNLDVTVTLPMLHPKYEENERHYIDETISQNINVHRALRSKKHAVTDAEGRIEIVEWNDFPTMYNSYGAHSLDLATIVERERKGWKEGRDMETEFREGREACWVWYP